MIAGTENSQSLGKIIMEKRKRGPQVGVAIKFHKPADFSVVFKEMEKQNKLSVNALRKHFQIASPGIITRWLSEEGLSIEKSNKKKEELIDLESFKTDCRRGDYTIGEISKKYKISRGYVYKIIERNNIRNTSFVTEGFCPPAEEFIEIAKRSSSRKDIAKHYQTTLATVLNFIKRNKIEKEITLILEPITSQELRSELRTNPQHTLGSLSKKVNLNRSVVARILSENQIEIPRNQFDRWAQEYQHVIEQIDKFVQLNRDCGKTLKEISDEYSISVEQLKRAFKETDNPVVLHSCNKSKGELEIKEFIQSFGIECYSTKRLHNKKRYEIDCFIPDLNLGIEFCGEYWHAESTGTDKNYHKDKMLWCKEQGINLITIFQHEWVYKRSIIESVLRHKIGKTENRVFARNTRIKTIDAHLARDFHNENHLNGYINSGINLGLIDKDSNEIISVFSIAKSRFDKTHEFELSRFSTKKNFYVVGGLSKFMSNVPKNASLLTYVDLRFGNPEAYKKQGFNVVYETGVPNYFYFDKKTPELGFQSRMKFQKHKLKKLFPEIYSDNKTEKMIMEEAGFYRIYDCGNAKLSLNK